MAARTLSSWATFQLPPGARLLPSSCCSDKDLDVIVSKLGNKDQISLRKMQGTKKWEVVVDTGDPHPEEVVNLAWSSNGVLYPYLLSMICCLIRLQDRPSFSFTTLCVSPSIRLRRTFNTFAQGCRFQDPSSTFVVAYQLKHVKTFDHS